MTILEQVEHSLQDFRPKTQREYVALQLARRFNDLPNLAKYLAASKRHSKRTLLDAAKLARTRHELNRAPILGGQLKTGNFWTAQNRQFPGRPRPVSSTSFPRQYANRSAASCASFAVRI